MKQLIIYGFIETNYNDTNDVHTFNDIMVTYGELKNDYFRF